MHRSHGWIITGDGWNLKKTTSRMVQRGPHMGFEPVTTQHDKPVVDVGSARLELRLSNLIWLSQQPIRLEVARVPSWGPSEGRNNDCGLNGDEINQGEAGYTIMDFGLATYLVC